MNIIGYILGLLVIVSCYYVNHLIYSIIDFNEHVKPSNGYNQSEISRILQISQPTINRDLSYLRQQAKSNIKKYIDDYHNQWGANGQRYDRAAAEADPVVITKDTVSVPAVVIVISFSVAAKV